MSGIWMSISTTSARRRARELDRRRARRPPRRRRRSLAGSPGSPGTRRARAPGRQRSAPRSACRERRAATGVRPWRRRYRRAASSASSQSVTGMSPAGRMTVRAPGRSVRTVKWWRRATIIDLGICAVMLAYALPPTTRPHREQSVGDGRRAAVAASAVPAGPRAPQGATGSRHGIRGRLRCQRPPDIRSVPADRRGARGAAHRVVARHALHPPSLRRGARGRARRVGIRGRDRGRARRRRRHRGHGCLLVSAVSRRLGRGPHRLVARSRRRAADGALRTASAPTRGDRSIGDRDRPCATRVRSRSRGTVATLGDDRPRDRRRDRSGLRRGRASPGSRPWVGSPSTRCVRCSDCCAAPIGAHGPRDRRWSSSMDCWPTRAPEGGS